MVITPAEASRQASVGDVDRGTIPQTRRVRPRGKIISAFKGFDDGFDQSHVQLSRKVVENAHFSLQSGTRVETSPAVEISSAGEGLGLTNQSSRKRLRTSDGDGNESLLETILPAAAAMKRRRVEEEKAARDAGPVENVQPVSSDLTSTSSSKNVKPSKEINIQHVVRQRRRAEEEEAMRDEESLANMEEMTIEEMKTLAVVEEMEVSPRPPPSSRTRNNGEDDRWDPRWNGRKNFKKFRRRNLGDLPRRVIVRLEEVSKHAIRSRGINKEPEQNEEDQIMDSPDQSQTFVSARSHSRSPSRAFGWR